MTLLPSELGERMDRRSRRTVQKPTSANSNHTRAGHILSRPQDVLFVERDRLAAEQDQFYARTGNLPLGDPPPSRSCLGKKLAASGAVVLFLCMALGTRAEARTRHHHHHYATHHATQVASNGDKGVVAHPEGCPHTAFCGCGVSDKVFGHPVRELYLAANWYRFPRASAASGNVAIFGRHHVAYIMQAFGDGTALVYDPNSGGHLTRIHRRNIASATIVSPTGNLASAGVTQKFASASWDDSRWQREPRRRRPTYASAL